VTPTGPGAAIPPSNPAEADPDALRNVSASEADEMYSGPSDEELYPSASDEDSVSQEEQVSEEAQEKVAAPAAGMKPSQQKERIPVGKDKKEYIEIDYEDREGIKNAYLMARGARKWQAQKDETEKKFTALDTEHRNLKSNWEALEQAFSKQGVEGVIDLLEGRSGAYQAHLEQQLRRAEFLKNATPEEKANLEAREIAAKQARELERERAENKKFREDMQKERETAELRSLESRLHPEFEKYRFRGKLGDTTDEHMFDEMLWTTALKKLEPYEEKGLEITPEMVSTAFRSVSQSLRKRIVSHGEKVAQKAVETKKAQAAERVQSTVSSTYEGGKGKSAREEALGLIQKGDLASVFKQWSRLGGALNGRK